MKCCLVFFLEKFGKIDTCLKFISMWHGANYSIIVFVYTQGAILNKIKLYS